MFFDSKAFGLIGAEVMKEIAANTNADNAADYELTHTQPSFFQRLIRGLRFDQRAEVNAQPVTPCGDDLASNPT